MWLAYRRRLKPTKRQWRRVNKRANISYRTVGLPRRSLKATKANKTEKMAFKAAANAMKAIFSEGDFLSRKKFIKILSTYFIEKENSKGKIGFFLSMVKWRCEEADSHNSAQAPLT